MSEAATSRVLLLNTVWDYLCAHNRRPTACELDRILYRDHGVNLDLAATLTLPWFTLDPASADGWIDDAAAVGLTAAGLHTTGRGERELRLFIAAVRQAADREREFEIIEPGRRPCLTAGDVAAANQLGTSPASARLLQCVGQLLRTEAWGGIWVEGAADPHWTFEISREVRQFSGVTDIEAYLRVRGQQPPRSPTRGFDMMFWAALAGVFTVLGVLITATSQWSALKASSLVTFALAVVVGLHRRRSDRWWFVYVVLGTIIAAGLMGVSNL